MNFLTFLPLFIFLIFAVPASIIDIRTFRIPDVLTGTGFCVLAIEIGIMQIVKLPEALLAAIICFLVFYLIRITTKGLGFGDVKFAAFVGLFCGLRLSFLSFFIAAVTGFLAALILLLTKKKTWRQPIPFAPFLALGAVSSWFLSLIYNIF